MPEPNLPPLRLYEDSDDLNNSLPNQVNIAAIKKSIIDLPEIVRQTLVKTFNLRIETAHVIVVCLVQCHLMIEMFKSNSKVK